MKSVWNSRGLSRKQRDFAGICWGVKTFEVMFGALAFGILRWGVSRFVLVKTAGFRSD